MVQSQQSKPVEVLRARRGPVPEELLARVREHNRIKSAIRRVLAEGPKTPPQVAAETGYAVATVFWHLMSMRKYGQVRETGEDGGYRLYALTEEHREQ